MTTRATTFDELYTTIGTIVEAATGRKWWRKDGLQAIPKEPYSTVLLSQSSALEHEVVEDYDDPAGGFTQIPWNAGKIDCKIELFKGAAINDAMKLRSALALESRYWDLWMIAGKVGAVDVINISGTFRADTEPRAEIRLTFYANTAIIPIDNSVGAIESVTVDLTHVSVAGVEDEQTLTITDPTPES